MSHFEIVGALRSEWPDKIGWSLDGETLAGLIWPEELGPRPTNGEINAAVGRFRAQQNRLHYRLQRKDDYIRLLGKNPLDQNFVDTVGDVLDIVLAELVARGPAVTPEFGVLLGKIQQIKTKYPKPD